MVKVHRTITIDKSVDANIKERGINFSEWVEKEWANQFMNIDTLKEEIKTREIMIKEMQEKRKAYLAGLSRSEKRYLLDVPRLVKEGKEYTALLARFNNTFNKIWDIKTFKSHIQHLWRKQHEIQ